ncbi:MAG: hypothetical protein WDM79_14765 [Terricaulis sp.]
MVASGNPYRRTLSQEELAFAQKTLTERWGITTHYWYPLTESTHPLTAKFPLVAVSLDKRAYLPAGLEVHDEKALYRKIRSFLDRRGVKRVFEIWEHGESYSLDLSLAAFRYGPGLEGYWFDEASDWLVYCSHESSVTLAGAIAEIVAPPKPG